MTAVQQAGVGKPSSQGLPALGLKRPAFCMIKSLIICQLGTPPDHRTVLRSILIHRCLVVVYNDRLIGWSNQQ